MELEIKVSEKLSRSDQREFFKNFLHRTTPGIRFVFMRDHAIRKGVKFTRSDRKLTARI
jgi:hypothetical protein